MKFLMTSAAIAAMAFMPVTAQAQLFGGLDNSTLLSGGLGAGIGAGVGRAIAPSGNNTEGAAIGALVGGLAAVSYTHLTLPTNREV